jgi:glutathione S-transferase
MNASSCKLYGETMWISPYVFSSFVALREKGVPFEVVEVALVENAHRDAAYREAAPTQRVPSLDDAGFRLAESSAIAEYLEERFPPPEHPRLFPADLRARAVARQIMAWLRSDLGALRDERSTVTMFYRFELNPLSAAAQRDADKLIELCAHLLPANGGPLFGDWSLADSELAFMLHRLILTGEEVPPRLRAYAEREWQRPSAQAYVAHARPAEVPDGYWAFAGTPRPR